MALRRDNLRVTPGLSYSTRLLHPRKMCVAHVPRYREPSRGQETYWHHDTAIPALVCLKCRRPPPIKPNLLDSDHDMAFAPLRLLGRFARSRRRRTPIECSSMDRRAIPSGIDSLEQLVQLVVGELKGKPRGTIVELAAHFADIPLRFAWTVMLCAALQPRVQW